MQDFSFKHPDRLILILGSIFLLPLIYNSDLIDPVLIPRFILLSFIVLSIACFLIIKSIKNESIFDFTIYNMNIFKALTVLFIISALSLLKAINVVDGIFELQKMFLYFSFLIIAVFTINSELSLINSITRSFIIVGIILSIIGICQYFDLYFVSIPGTYLPYATMANKNIYAISLFLILTFSAYGFFSFNRGWYYLSILSFFLLLFSLLTTQTRSVWLGIGTGTLITGFSLIFVYRRITPAKEQINYYVKRLLPFALIILVSSGSYLGLSDYTKINYSDEDKKASIDERLNIWGKTIHMSSENILFGVGLGQWKIIFPKYGLLNMRSEQGDTHFQRPHNDYLWILSETGIFGLISFVSVIGISLFYLFKILFYNGANKYKSFALAMLFGLSGYSAVSFFSYPKERISITVIILIMLACIISIFNKLYPTNHRSVYMKKIVLPVTIVLTSVFIYTGTYRLYGETQISKTFSFFYNQRMDVSLQKLNKINTRYYNMDSMSTPISWYKGVANYSLGNLEEAIHNFKVAYNLHPFHLHILNNLGTCYEKSGDIKNAIKYFKMALNISPNFREGLVNLGSLYYNIGSYQEGYFLLNSLSGEASDHRTNHVLEKLKGKIK